MKSFSRVILAFAVAVLGFVSLVFDAGLGTLRVNKLSTGFSRTPSQIVSTHTPKAADSDSIGSVDNGHSAENDNGDEGHTAENGNGDDGHAADGDNVDDDHAADGDNVDEDSENNAGNADGDADGNTDGYADGNTDVTDGVDGTGDNLDNADNTNGNAGANDDDNTGNGTNDDDVKDDANNDDNTENGANDDDVKDDAKDDDNAGNDANNDDVRDDANDDDAGDGAGDGADDSKPIDGDTPPTELDLVKLELTQVMDDFVKVFSQFDFSMYTSRNGRVFELYCFGYLYTNGRFDTKWLKSSNIYDYQEAITSMKSLTTLVTKVLESAREEVPAPNLVSFEKYFESDDDYINQLNAEYQPLTYVTCQNARPFNNCGTL